MHTYCIEIYDSANLRVYQFREVEYADLVCRTPDRPDTARLVLRGTRHAISPGYRLRVRLDNTPICDATISLVTPHWGCARVPIAEIESSAENYTELRAERPPFQWDGPVARAYVNESIDEMVRDLIQRAPTCAHYHVDHLAFPDGATREYQKFLARRLPENELELRGIQRGQWVGGDRVDFSAAYAKDGDTIAGLIVDGQPWPDVRLMMIDAEETSRNSHAIKRHPEVAAWTDIQYQTSAYRRRADAARDKLGQLLATRGIEAIELNPHRNATGEYDDRVDAYGRYLGLVFGGGICFNAAMVELGLADVFLYEEGRYLAPDLQLKDFFSYGRFSRDSVSSVSGHLKHVDVKASLYESLTALAYAARGYVWSVSPEGAVTFERVDKPRHVVYVNTSAEYAALGANSENIINRIEFSGNPIEGTLEKTYVRDVSRACFGTRRARLAYYGFSRESDTDDLVEGLLDDLAYPSATGEISFTRDIPTVRVGDVIELRGEGVTRVTLPLPGEWGEVARDRLLARVKKVHYRFTGETVRARVQLTSPLRSVESPLTFIVRSQPGPTVLYQFRLDDPGVALDLAFHLD